MAKTRLSVGKRDILKQLVHDKVTRSDYDDEIQGLELDIDQWAIDEVEARWPTKDMDVLKKYDKTGKFNWVSISISEMGNSRGRDMRGWYFLDGEERTFADQYSSYRVIVPEGRIVPDIDAWLLATQTRDNYLRDLKDKYFKLIDSSRNYEEVVDVWDEASIVRSRIETSSSSLMALSQETINLIKEDTASRKLAVA